MLNRNKILIAILITSFIVSIVFFNNDKKKYTRITFEFFHEIDDRTVFEERFVRLGGTYSENAETVVDELFLGPHSVFNKKLTQYNLKYNLFYINDRVAYLDLPISFVLNYKDEEHTIDETVLLIKKNILSNITKINSVILTVNGQLLNEGPSKSELPKDDQ